MSEAFVVSARKYRPDTWETVVGQKSITRTLQNAIATQQIAQAYLFCGPRGVGKTTCARIFAKAVNDGFIDEGTDLSFNVFELDAASNNGVEDIRGIVDTVRIPPQVGKYKIYIIDEVHMLSSGAFNAFLKTLEEPPAHAIFILATTEKHKIIPTILSRCQIFDFNRIRVADMTEHLADIAGKEGVTFEPEALHVIAEKADGAMRDALSIFDQVVAFCGRNLTYDLVIENLNVLDYDYYFQLTDLAFKEDISSSLLLFNTILNKGFDAHHFVSGWGGHLRRLLVSKDPATIALLEVSENVGQKYVEQAALMDLRFLIDAMDLVNDCDIHYRASKHQRLLVELTIMKICSIQSNRKEGEKKNRIIPFRGAPAVTSKAVAFSTSQSIVQAPKNVLDGTPTSLSAQKVDIAPELPRVKPALGLRETIAKSKDVISIQSVMVQKAKEQQEKALEVVEELGGDYQEEQVSMAWKSFLNSGVLPIGQIKTAMSMAELKYNGGVMTLEFPSETQVIYFNDIRSELANYFKEKENIVGLQFETSITKIQDLKVAMLTNAEKFEAWRKENPALENLYQRFQLRLE